MTPIIPGSPSANPKGGVSALALKDCPSQTAPSWSMEFYYCPACLLSAPDLCSVMSSLNLFSGASQYWRSAGVISLLPGTPLESLSSTMTAVDKSDFLTHHSVWAQARACALSTMDRAKLPPHPAPQTVPSATHNCRAQNWPFVQTC